MSSFLAGSISAAQARSKWIIAAARRSGSNRAALPGKLSRNSSAWSSSRSIGSAMLARTAVAKSPLR